MLELQLKGGTYTAFKCPACAGTAPVRYVRQDGLHWCEPCQKWLRMASVVLPLETPKGGA